MLKRKVDIMKKFLEFLITVCIIVLPFVFYRENIVTFAIKNINQKLTLEVPGKNDYSSNNGFNYVKNTNDFRAKDRQDILNIIYTILNSGKKEYSFYCDLDYKNCQDDIKAISSDQTLLSIINNMVSPFNSYKKMYITIDSYNKANITVDKLYSEEEIIQINSKIDSIISEIIKEPMTNREKIKAYHDYIINHSVYDEQRAELIKQGSTNESNNSHKANGPLIEGKALCSGYSDAMKLFLDRLGLPNYKISNESHIWNLVYIEGRWLHIDLTWDDPVTPDHRNVLLDKFFLIDTNTLEKLDTTNHMFNKMYYSEI